MNGELITGSIKIDRLRNRIMEGEIKVPPFQRAYVWKKEQVIELMDSIYNDYPIGSVLLWEVNEKLPSIRNLVGFELPDKPHDFPLSYILDGQQRISSIFGVFNNKIESIDSSISNNFDIYFDLDEENFIHVNDLKKSNSNLKMSSIFDVKEFFKVVSLYSEEKQELAIDLQSKFQNYEIPTVTIKKKSKSEVGTIFERINSTGTALSALELMIAWTWSEEYDLKSTFNTVYEKLDERDFSNIKEKLVLQCFGAVIEKTAITKDILELDPEKIRNQSEKVIKSLEKALDYLRIEFNLFSSDFLPKPQILVPLTYFFSKVHRPSAEQSDLIKKWFWRVSFSDRYSAGTDTKMNEDIEFFEEILGNDFRRIDKYQITINKDIFKNQKLSKSNSFVKASLLLMSKENPLDLINGDKIDLNLTLSIYNRKEFHHVFPKSYLKKTYGYNDEKTNVIANYCFLPSSSNKIVSDKAPNDYFNTLVPVGSYDEILRSNILPLDSNCYKTGAFETFIDERSKLLMAKVKEYSGL